MEVPIVKNNKGLSLVEILVTITILAIIAVPLIRSFMTAVKLNNEARLLQNGTQTAKDVVELFKGRELEKLISIYGLDVNDSNIVYRYDMGADGEEIKSSEGEYIKYLFENIGDRSYTEGENTYNYFEGIDGERFFVDVTLDSKPKGGDVYSINQYQVPKITDLNVSDSIIIYTQYSSMDSQIGTLFGDNLANSTNSYKQGNVIINCEYISEMEYNYSVDLDLTYEYLGTEKTVSYSISEGTITSADEIPDIYIVMTQFNKSILSFVDGTYYTTDSINVSYTYNDNSIDPVSDHEKKAEIYLIEQSAEAESFPGEEAHMDINNVFFTDGNTGTTAELESTDFTGKNIDIYSNIINMGDNKSLTGGGQIEDYMYEMTVDVRYKYPDGDLITSFVTTK